MTDPRCTATVLQYDDRWGGFVDRCELTGGHPGSHLVARTACDPVAWLRWDGTHEEAKEPTNV